MKSLSQNLSQYEYKTLETTVFSEDSGKEVCYSVDVVPARVTQRVMAGLIDEETEKGISVAFFPATGEVCDLTNGGGVIGYLSNVPMVPGDPVHCEMRVSRFGRNWVNTLSINGETLLYPSVSAPEGDARFLAVAGQEIDDSSATISWKDVKLALSA